MPTLCKVAVLVDKYQWHALMTPHAILWFESLLDIRSLPATIDETSLQRLWIAWLFGMKAHFKALSRHVQQYSCRSIDLTDDSIRLPNKVLSKWTS